MSKIISLSEPYLIGNYKKYILECLRDNWISTGGKYINKFEAKISKYLKIIETKNMFFICEIYLAAKITYYILHYFNINKY